MVSGVGEGIRGDGGDGIRGDGGDGIRGMGWGEAMVSGMRRGDGGDGTEGRWWDGGKMDGTEGRWWDGGKMDGTREAVKWPIVSGVGSLILFQLRRPQMFMQHSHCPILQQCCWDFPKFLIHELDLSMTGLPQGTSSFHTDSFVT